jgi:hypothetical protein
MRWLDRMAWDSICIAWQCGSVRTVYGVPDMDFNFKVRHK